MIKRIVLAAALAVAATTCAYPQAGQFPSGWIQGNAGASGGQASPSSVTAILDRALGSTRGAIIERGASGWVIVGPGSTAGLPWISNGAGADPSFQALPNSGLVPMPANTVKCNPTGSTANAQDCGGRTVSITDFCSTAQIAADISTCAQNAINSFSPSASNGGGKIIFPARYSPYNLTGTINLNVSFVSLVGEGPQASFINCANTAADCLVVGHATNATRQQSVEGLGIWGASKTGGSNIKVQGSTYNVLLQRVDVENCIRCLDVGPGTNNTTVRDAVLSPNQSASDYGIYWHAPGDGTARSDALILNNVVVESNWSNATGLGWDGLANTLEISSVRLLHANYGMRIMNTAGSTANYPQFLNAFDLEIEGAKTRALSIEGGADFKITGSDINNLTGGASQGNLDDAAIRILADTTKSYTRGVNITNSRVGLSRTNGLYSDARDVQLTNVTFVSTSFAGAGTSAVIRLGATSMDTQLTNIRCEEFGGAALASYCVQIDASADRVKLTDIDAHYVQTGAVNDLGSTNAGLVSITDPSGALYSKPGAITAPSVTGAPSLDLPLRAPTGKTLILGIASGGAADLYLNNGAFFPSAANALYLGSSGQPWAGTFFATTQLTSTYTVATLPTCNAGARGTFAVVTDASAPAYNATVAGAGAITIPVFCNGTAWTAH